MADIIKITDGTTEIPLVLDTDGFEMLGSGNQFGIPEHDNLYHESAWMDGEMLVRKRVKNRIWPMRLAVRGSDDDDISALLASLNRLARQASEYHINDNVDKVYLHFNLDGSTNTTYYDVIDIKYDGLSVLTYMNRQNQEIVFEKGFEIEIETKPYGYGDEVTLHNELQNPHFQEDSNGDGLADGWNETGSPNTSINTSIYLTGAQSQKVEVVGDGPSTDGIESDTVACSNYQSESFVAYAWVYRSSGDEIIFSVWGDNSGGKGTDSYVFSEDTDTGEGGNTWRKLEVTGTVGASDTTLTMRIERLSPDLAATYYVDKCYLQFASSAPSAGWMSASAIVNHTDDDDGDINYIDIDDSIAGDCQADTRITIENTDASNEPTDFWIAKRTRENQTVEITLDPNASNASSGGSATTGNSDYIFDGYMTVSVSSSSWGNLVSWDMDDVTTETRWGGKYLAISIGASDHDSSIEFKARTRFRGTQTITETEPVYGNDEEVLVLGVVEFPPMTNLPSGNPDDWDFDIQGRIASGSEGYDCEAIFLMPLDQMRVISHDGYFLGQGEQLIDDGIRGSVYEKWVDSGTHTGGYATSFLVDLGDQISITPGRQERIFIFNQESLQNYNANASSDVTIEYRPTTEFFL